MTRREFILGGGAAASTVFAQPIHSAMGAYHTSIVTHAIPDVYVPCQALKLVGDSRVSYIDSGIVVPRTGDFYVESDFVFFQTVPEYSVQPYWTIGGISPFASPFGISVRGHVGWSIYIFNSGGKERFRFSSNINILNSPYSVRYGIVNGMEYLEVNGVVQTKEVDGTERGGEDATFVFFSSQPAYQNYRGTILGQVRLFSDSEKVFDGEPCIRERDGVCGFYDTVQERFCPSVGYIEPWEG